MAITDEQRDALFLAWNYCDAEDKSTEFMLQYMSDTAEVEYDEVVDFIRETSEEEREEWYNENFHLFREHLSMLEYDGACRVHFVRSGFTGSDGKSEWLIFREDAHEQEPWKSGIKRITQTEMLKIFNNDK